MSLRTPNHQGEPVRIVTVDQRICVYVDDCVVLPPPNDDERAVTFGQYLEMNKVNAVLNVPILADSEWGELRGTDEFMDDPTTFGFEWSVPDGPVVIRFK